MKKMILLVIAAAMAGILMFGTLRYCMGMGGNDLVVLNDTPDTISCDFEKEGKGVEMVVKPGATVTGGKGFMRFFTASKEGSYEIMYPFPRPSMSVNSVNLTKIMQAAKQDKVDNELYTKKGMIGDIKVMYEAVLEID